MAATLPSEPHTARPRAPRSDGEQSRERLLRAALELFADHGFAKTSTREIAEAAGTNIAAISYYFGDKAGLYRAVFSEPMGDPAEDIARFADPALPLADALRGFYVGFLEPLRQGDVARRCMKLHMREMLEPTGLWQQEVERSIRPSHEALVRLLQRHLGLRRIDDDLHRLAVALSALGVHLHVGRDVTDTLVPRLNAVPRALDIWLDRLVTYAVGMVDAERARRSGADSR
jgi:AcrR family transcriptional regulator